MMRITQHRLAIVLPAYNESHTLAETISAFHAMENDAYFLIVDNNSNDGTGEITRETLAALRANRRVVRETRQGKDWAVRTGFAAVDADV